MTDLGTRLRELPIPDSEPAMLAAARVISAEVTRSDAPKRVRRWGGALVAALLIGLAFTQPGRALTGDLGRLVGIGDEPTEAGDRDAVVIGVGDARSFPYEVVATGRNSSTIPAAGEPPVACISLEFPTIKGLTAANCLTDDARRALERDSINAITYGAPPELYPDAELIVQGIATTDVARVSVEYTTADGERATAPAEVSALTDELKNQIGVTDASNSYVAFLPPSILDPPAFDGGPLTIDNARDALMRIEVVAYAADGTELHREPAMGGMADMSLVMTAPKERFADGLRVQKISTDCSRDVTFGTKPRPVGAELSERIDVCVAEALQEGTGGDGP